MDPSPEQWKYDAGAPLKSPRSPRGDTEPPAPNAPGKCRADQYEVQTRGDTQ